MLPTLLEAGQLRPGFDSSAATVAAGQSGALAMLPTAPGGSESVRPVSIWWPSGRVISRCETEFAPACVGTAEASSTDGWKGFGSWQPVMLTLLGSVIVSPL